MAVCPHIMSLYLLMCRKYTKFKLAILILVWYVFMLACILVTVVSVNVAGECNSTCIMLAFFFAVVALCSCLEI
jgi:hypothetical protein